MLIYKEIGFGIGSFVSSEIEYSDGTEVRVDGWIQGGEFVSVYLRLRIFGLQIVLDSKDGLKIEEKGGVKCVVGVRCR